MLGHPEFHCFQVMRGDGRCPSPCTLPGLQGLQGPPLPEPETSTSAIVDCDRIKSICSRTFKVSFHAFGADCSNSFKVPVVEVIWLDKSKGAAGQPGGLPPGILADTAFYASAPIVCCSNRVGSLYIADTLPRPLFSALDAAKLQGLADLLSALLEQRRCRMFQSEEQLARVVVGVNYRLKEPLTTLLALKKGLAQHITSLSCPSQDIDIQERADHALTVFDTHVKLLHCEVEKALQSVMTTVPVLSRASSKSSMTPVLTPDDHYNVVIWNRTAASCALTDCDDDVEACGSRRHHKQASFPTPPGHMSWTSWCFIVIVMSTLLFTRWKAAE